MGGTGERTDPMLCNGQTRNNLKKGEACAHQCQHGCRHCCQAEATCAHQSRQGGRHCCHTKAICAHQCRHGCRHCCHAEATCAHLCQQGCRHYCHLCTPASTGLPTLLPLVHTSINRAVDTVVTLKPLAHICVNRAAHTAATLLLVHFSIHSYTHCCETQSCGCQYPHRHCRHT